jgi:hypothetical protein
MSGERFRIVADIIVMDWLQTTDPTRDVINIHLTNRDILVDMIAEELKKEHDDTTKKTRNK